MSKRPERPPRRAGKAYEIIVPLALGLILVLILVLLVIIAMVLTRGTPI